MGKKAMEKPASAGAKPKPSKPAVPPAAPAPASPAASPASPAPATTPAPASPAPATTPAPAPAIPATPPAAATAPAPAATPAPAAPATATPPPAAQVVVAPPAPAQVEKTPDVIDSIETEKPIKIRVVIDQSGLFKPLMAVINDLVEEISMVFDKRGLHFTAITESHVAMTQINLGKEFFSEFKINAPFVFNVSASDFVKILKRGNVTDDIALVYDNSEVKNKSLMAIELIGTKAKRVFKLKNKALTSDSLTRNRSAEGFVASYSEKIKDTAIAFTMNLSLLDQTIKDIELLSDLFSLIADPATGMIEFVGQGDTADYHAEFPKGELSSSKEIVFDLKKEQSQATYSVQFVRSILPLSGVADDVIILFTANSPIIFDFTLKRDDKPAGKFYYLLAPRVPDEEGDDFEEGEGEEGDDQAPDVESPGEIEQALQEANEGGEEGASDEEGEDE